MAKKSNKKGLVLIDGAAGYLGKYLVQEFISAGYKVRSTDLKGTNLEYAKKLGAETVYSDLLDAESLEKVCKGAEWVVHAAAAFDLGLPYPVLERVNLNGTENMCKTAVKCGVSKFLHISTGGVYGKPAVKLVTEDHRFKPLDAYSRTKYEAEKVVEHYRKQNNLYTMMFRPTALYGPGGKYLAGVFMTVPVIARYKEKTKLPLLDGGQLLNMVHVRDVASSAVFVLENDIPSGEAFNLADSDIMTAAEFFSLYYKAFGIEPGRLIKIPGPVFDLSMALMSAIAGEKTLSPVNKWLTRTWDEIKTKYKLVPELKPVISKDQLLFLAGDHAYDNSKLIKAGYKFKYPKFEKGFMETVKWYQDSNWIPVFK